MWSTAAVLFSSRAAEEANTIQLSAQMIFKDLMAISPSVVDFDVFNVCSFSGFGNCLKSDEVDTCFSSA